jgi:hypothetical protein
MFASYQYKYPFILKENILYSYVKLKNSIEFISLLNEYFHYKDVEQRNKLQNWKALQFYNVRIQY